MAIKSQIRLAQLTGSLDDGGAANDPSSANKSLAATSLQEVMDAIGAGIQKIHGASSFNLANAGEFSHTIKPASDDGAALGTTSNNWSDLFIADEGVINLGDDQDVKLTHVPDAGVVLNSTNYLGFNDAGTAISSPADGKLLLSSDGASDDAIEIKTTNAAGEIVIESAHTAGRAIFLDGNAAAGSIVDIDAGILQIDAAGVGHIQTGGTLSLATGTSGVAINIGHSTSEVTIGDNLTVTGDLTVSGDTTTVNTANLAVEDPLIVLGSGNTGTTVDLGLVMVRNGNNIAAFFDESDADTFKFQQTLADGTGTTVASPDNRTALPVRVDVLEISGSLASNGGKLRVADPGDGTSRFIAESNRDILLNAEGTGKILFTDLSAQTSNGFGLVINVATDDKAELKLGSEASNFMVLDTGNDRVDVESGFRLKNPDASTGAKMQMFEGTNNGSNFSTFRAPSNLANDSVVFELPNSNGTADYVLSTNGSGVTSWVAQGGQANAFKAQLTLNDATLAANNGLATATGISEQDISAIQTANASKAVDVYVNGQLLVSGSGPFSTNTSAASFTSGDYIASTLDMSAFDIKFAFGLEKDDVVSIIGRA